MAFKHKKPSLSGVIRITTGGDGKTNTVVLTTNARRQWQISLSGQSFSARDDGSRVATGRLVNRKWDISPESDRVLRASRAEFRLGLVVAGDVVPVRRTRAASAALATASQQVNPTEGFVVQQTPGTVPTVPNCLEIPDGTCSRNQYLGSSPPSFTLEVAKLKATYAMDDNCGAASGQPCCCRLKCFCPCATALIDPFFDVDALCGCDCRGNTYP